MKSGITRILSLAVILAAATAGCASAQSWSAAAAPAQECRRIQSYGSGFLEQCGDRLNSVALNLLEFKREAGSDLHGRFSFYCPIELMCEGEPTIIGIFVAAEKWQTGAKDERAVFEMANALSYPHRPLPPMPSLACPVFDVWIDGIAGRAVCFDESDVKGGNVFVVAADDRVAFLLGFYQREKSANALKEKVVELLPRFKIERATGDAALLKWFR